MYFVQWEWLMPFCLGDLPGQYKRLCIAPLTSSLTHLLAAGQTSLNEESIFSLSLLPGPISAADWWTFQHERAHSFSLLPGLIPAADRWTSQHKTAYSTFDHCFFRRTFFHLLLLSPKINRTTGWMLNSCSIIYHYLLLPATYSTRVLFVSSCY